MDDAKAQLAEKLKTSNNILITVSRNPTIDQLASCIGLTLLLDKQGKHTAAVFSGEVPSTLEFLQPEQTLQKNTDSLRDFIIAIDKSKADKLRYKVEDNLVRIFITPYKNSIGKADLEFNQGDFNVDVVVALGVQVQEDLDEAITAHGRILHDATLASISTASEPGLGVINWHDPSVSSLSELVTDLAQMLGAELLDSQVATALLTGIVSETERFSNQKTTPQTMSASAVLMAAGANQQLVVSRLETEIEPKPLTNSTSTGSRGGASKNKIKDTKDTKNKASDLAVTPDKPTAPADDMIEIKHDKLMADSKKIVSDKADDSDKTPPTSGSSGIGSGKASKNGIKTGKQKNQNQNLKNDQKKDSNRGSAYSKFTTKPLIVGDMLPDDRQAKASDFDKTKLPEPIGLPAAAIPKPLPLGNGKSDEGQAAQAFTSPPPAWMPPDTGQPPVPVHQNNLGASSTDIETTSKTPLTNQAKQNNIDGARDEINKALNSGTETLVKPIQALNARPLGADDLHPEPSQPSASDKSVATDTPLSIASNAPPPVPPPIPFQFGHSPPRQ